MAEEAPNNGAADDRTLEITSDGDQSGTIKAAELAGKDGEQEVEKQELLRKNQEMKEKLKELSGVVERLRSGESDMNRTLEEMQREIHQLEDEKKATDSIDTLVVELKSEISRLQRDLVNAKNESEESSAELSKLKHSLTEKQSRLEEAEKEVESLREVKAENESTLRELEKKIGLLEMREMDQKSMKLRVEEDMKKKLVEKEKEIDGLKKVVEALESEVGKNVSELEKWKSEKKVVDVALKHSEGKAAEMEIKLLELQKRAQEAEKPMPGVIRSANGTQKTSTTSNDGSPKGLLGSKTQWPVVAVGSAGAIGLALAVVYVSYTRRM